MGIRVKAILNFKILLVATFFALSTCRKKILKRNKKSHQKSAIFSLYQ